MPDFGYGKPMTSEQIEHYFEVKKARKEQGLPVYTDRATWDHRAGEDLRVGIDNEKVDGTDHPLLEMRLYDTEEDRVMIVDSVSNVWLDGFYIQMSVREEGTNSHALVFWENINSENESVLEGVKENRDRYEIVERPNVN